MAKVDGSLGSLVQGVSQQPSRARLPGQAEEQINVTNDEVFGMSRRPGTTIASQMSKYANDTQGHLDIEHGSIHIGTKVMTYMLRAGTEPLMTISNAGTSHPVHIPASVVPYMQTRVNDNPYGRRVLFKQMDNRTFVTNTHKTVQKLAGSPTDIVTDGAVVLCRGGKYAIGYRVDITIGSVTHGVGFCTPDGSIAAHGPKGQVAYIMDQLYKLFTDDAAASAAGTLPANEWVPTADTTSVTSAASRAWFDLHFTINLVGNHIIIRPKVAGSAYTVTAYETSNSDLLISTKEDAKKIAFLPTRAPLGMVTRIVGSLRKEDDYFLKWTVAGRTATGTVYDEDGIWAECTAPDEDYRLDPATMPHELVWDTANSRYTIKQLAWLDRRAGNDESNPFPKFVGQEIQDLVDFQGRAVFLHNDNMTMGKSDKYLDTFKQTATANLATDPINLRSTSTDGESKLIYGVAFNRDLVLFGTNKSQFMVSGRRTITGDTASIVLTSEFETDLRTRPQAIGQSIMFLSYTGKYTHVHEMFLSGTQNNHERRTVTDHIPRYIKGQASVFTANDGSNSAAIVGEDAKTVYIYEYMWIDDRRVQSAWSQWKFKCDVVHVTISEGVARITLRTASGGFVKTDLKLYRTDAAGLPFPLYMDMQQEITLNDQKTFTATVSGHGGDVSGVHVVSLDGTVPGSVVRTASVVLNAETTAPNTATITLPANYTGKVMVGELFKTRFIPTMPVLRDSDGVAVTQAELTITDFHITFEGSGPFDMTRVCSYEAPADYWTQRYSGRTLGDPDFKLGTVPIDSDTIDFPFSDLTTTSKLMIETMTHYPMTLTEIEWTGNLKNRSRRMINGG